MYTLVLAVFSLLSLFCSASTVTSTAETCSTKLGYTHRKSVPTSVRTVSTTQTAKITVTSTPETTVSIASATTELSIIYFYDYAFTTTDSSTTLSTTTLTITPTSYTSTTTLYSLTTTTATAYTTIPTPDNWLPIEDTTASVYPNKKRAVGHPHAPRAANNPPQSTATRYPQSVKCTLTDYIIVERTTTVTASTTSTITVQPTSYTYLTITQFTTTTVYPALTTYTVTASTPVYEVSVTTQVATLTATLEQPTYAACAPANELSQVQFPNGTVGYPMAPAAMGDSTSLFVVSSNGGLQVDCCAECWATPGCAGAHTAASQASPVECFLYVDEQEAANGGTCAQKDIFGAYQWEKPITVEENNGPFESLWNGPCGWLYLSGWNGK